MMTNSLVDNYKNLIWILPAICILGALFINIIIQLVAKTHQASRWSLVATLIGLGCACYTTLQRSQSLTAQAEISLWNDLLHITNWTTHIHLLSIGITLLMVLIIYPDNNQHNTGISLIMLLALLLGAYFLPLSNHWLMVYVSVTCISLASTVLIYNHGSQQASILASQKYLLYSTLASAIMLFGLSYTYGITGTLKVGVFPVDTTPSSWLSTIGPMGFLLALGGLFMLIGSFPYQFWVADIYAITPFPLVAYLSTITKAAVLGLMVQMGQVMSHSLLPELYMVVSTLWAIVASLTMLIGHFAALTTRNIARLLAYGSVAQTGFLLALLVTDLHTYTHITYYLVIYSIMNIASWLGLGLFHQAAKSLAIQDYAGLGRKFPRLGICWTIIMLALIGMPPTAGFTAKLILWSKLWESIQVANNPFVIMLLIISLLGTLMSLYYYLRIPYILFFKPIKHKATTPIGQSFIRLLVILLTILLVGLFMVGR
jgi:NADH-quinone oxidoreductase subunit N